MRKVRKGAAWEKQEFADSETPGGPFLQQAEGVREARECEIRQVIKHHGAQA